MSFFAFVAAVIVAYIVLQVVGGTILFGLIKLMDRKERKRTEAWKKHAGT